MFIKVNVQVGEQVEAIYLQRETISSFRKVFEEDANGNKSLKSLNIQQGNVTHQVIGSGEELQRVIEDIVRFEESGSQIPEVIRNLNKLTLITRELSEKVISLEKSKEEQPTQAA